MARSSITPTGKEAFFGEEEIIVSKTDLTGRITYANDVFLKVAGYTEKELLGTAHSVIRHPDMPRCVFKLLWDTIQSGNEIFAYVVNLCKNGDHYWVLAHVTPTFDNHGTIVGYHSNRRVPERAAVKAASDLYRMLLDEEKKYDRKEEATLASTSTMLNLLAKNDIAYEEFVWTL
ncbi:MAG: PAS domain-containing protein [Bdellovibrionales bacterium]|nr:PAS domain-containing protein [Bdellovibrionales bacterium]